MLLLEQTNLFFRQLQLSALLLGRKLDSWFLGFLGSFWLLGLGFLLSRLVLVRGEELVVHTRRLVLLRRFWVKPRVDLLATSKPTYALYQGRKLTWPD